VDRPDYYNQCWFTDGYFDYVPHFIDGMASMPELAPRDSDHMLRSSAVVQEISYQPLQISYRTAESGGTQKFRLTFQPVEILADGKPLAKASSLGANPGWVFDPSSCILEIQAGSRDVHVNGH
jgi:hypothetical protein